MSISIATRQAYSEIDEFLGLITDAERNKIPEKLCEFFRVNKDKYYIKHINPDMPIKSQNLKEETLAIIAFLNLKYWCEDEQEKERLMKIYAENDRKFQKVANEKQVEEIKIEEKNQRVDEKVEEIVLPVIKEDSIFKKIVNKILIIFKK